MNCPARSGNLRWPPRRTSTASRPGSPRPAGCGSMSWLAVCTDQPKAFELRAPIAVVAGRAVPRRDWRRASTVVLTLQPVDAIGTAPGSTRPRARRPGAAREPASAQARCGIRPVPGLRVADQIRPAGPHRQPMGVGLHRRRERRRARSCSRAQHRRAVIDREAPALRGVAGPGSRSRYPRPPRRPGRPSSGLRELGQGVEDGRPDSRAERRRRSRPADRRARPSRVAQRLRQARRRTSASPPVPPCSAG